MPRTGRKWNSFFLQHLFDGLSRLLVLLLLVSGLGCAVTAQTNSPATIRVMSYNIHHGEGIDGKVDLLRIAQLIKEQSVDIVALQEVDKGTERTQRRDFPAELAELTGMICVFSNNLNHMGGEYGNAVLTKFPVKRSSNLHFKKIDEAEQRGILQLTLGVRGREVVFMNTHLDHRPNDAARWSSVAEIETLAAKFQGKPMLMCGDFNDTPKSRVCERIGKLFDDSWTLIGEGEGLTSPAEKPRRRIDYIWISKDRSLIPVKASVLQSEASDHLPVVVEFKLE